MPAGDLTASWWRASLPPQPARRPLHGDTDVDVGIIGAGYTGLWTAYYLAKADPALRIAILERDHAGFGASGRNGGWCSALLPTGLPATVAEVGLDAARRQQLAMFDAVDEVGRVATAEGIDCHYAKGGTVTVARNAAQLQRLVVEVAEWQAAGFGDDLQLLGPAAATERLGASAVLGGTYTPHCAALHPARLAAGLAAAVERAGVAIHEHTPVTGIAPGRLSTPHGTVRCAVVVRATEAYTARFDRRCLLPIYSLMVATEPLPARFWERAGLSQRETFTDGRHLIIYGQRTADDRLAFGGRGAGYRFASRISDRGGGRVHAALAATLTELFPHLGKPEIAYRWGGQLGAARDWHPSVGFDRATGEAWAGGYVGDGVAASNLAGRTLAALITGSDDPIASLPWVGHRSPRWEPEPLRWIGVNAMARLPRSIDRAEERVGRSPRLRSWLLDRATGKRT